MNIHPSMRLGPRERAAYFRAMIPYRKLHAAKNVTTSAGELNEVLAGMLAQLRGQQRRPAGVIAAARILEELGA